MKVTILMPCLNEVETLGKCLEKAKDWACRSGTNGEIIVADNGSTDGSQDIARAYGARVIDVAERGYGSAIYHGALAAEGDYIIMGDADDSYDFGKLDAFVEKMDQGFDLVMGNRFAGGIAPGAMPWKNRYIGNPILSWIGRALFKCPAGDFHCGLRGFRKDAFLKMDLRTTGMEFASEMVIKANLFGMKITEVPVTLSKDGRSRPPHLRPWRDGWRHLRFMLLFSPRWLFFIPGLCISLVCHLLYVFILISPLKIGELTFNLNALFYAEAGLIFGLMTCAFGLIVQLFGMREGLLQEHEAPVRFRNLPILEIGGTVSLLLMGAGIYLGFDLAARWGGRNLSLHEQDTFLRMVSLSTLLIILSGMGFLCSLVIGFLALPIRRAPIDSKLDSWKNPRAR